MHAITVQTYSVGVLLRAVPSWYVSYQDAKGQNGQHFEDVNSILLNENFYILF